MRDNGKVVCKDETKKRKIWKKGKKDREQEAINCKDTQMCTETKNDISHNEEGEAGK